MSLSTLNHALLRPAILQILRAVGYHAARPSVVDALTDLTAKYLMLLASRTVDRAIANHNDSIPDITDVRLAMSDCGLLTPSMTATEEVWRELLRQPISEVPERNGLRDMELATRDEEDTAEVREFLAWFQGPVFAEIRRIASLQQQEQAPVEGGEAADLEDYLTVLKKKHSKTGEESRFKGTVLGVGSDSKPVKIDGGPETMKDWLNAMKERDASKVKQKPTATASEDIIMTG